MIDHETQRHEEFPGIYNGVEGAETIAPDYDNLSRLVFLSYRFSQGGIGLQNRMLSYIRDNSHPYLFETATITEVHPRTHAMIKPFFLNDSSHPQTAIPWDYEGNDFVKNDELVDNELIGLFERIVDDDLMKEFEPTPRAIAIGIIAMDADYLSRPNGRSGDSDAMKVRVAPYKRDPYASMFLKYGVLGASTGAAEFDDMFRAASSLETVHSFDKLTLFQLMTILHVYCRYHDSDETDQLSDFKAVVREAYYGR